MGNIEAWSWSRSLNLLWLQSTESPSLKMSLPLSHVSLTEVSGTQRSWAQTAASTCNCYPHAWKTNWDDFGSWTPTNSWTVTQWVQFKWDFSIIPFELVGAKSWSQSNIADIIYRLPVVILHCILHWTSLQQLWHVAIFNNHSLWISGRNLLEAWLIIQIRCKVRISEFREQKTFTLKHCNL